MGRIHKDPNLLAAGPNHLYERASFTYKNLLKGRKSANQDFEAVMDLKRSLENWTFLFPCIVAGFPQHFPFI